MYKRILRHTLVLLGATCTYFNIQDFLKFSYLFAYTINLSRTLFAYTINIIGPIQTVQLCCMRDAYHKSRMHATKLYCPYRPL